jgi:hypothetical protein
MNGFAAAISGVGSAIGRYFGIVSFIPSLLLTGFIFALIESGAWNESSSLDWARAGNAFTHLGNLALLILISIALGVVVHPIQFALVQFFEGYWGTRRWAQRARVVRMRHHRDKYESYLLDFRLGARDKLKSKDLAAIQAAGEARRAARNADQVDYARKLEEALQSDKAAALLGAAERLSRLSIADEITRLAAGYPPPNRVGRHLEYDNIMPTRLGNALRKYERQAGSQYGLDAVSVIQHISFVAPAERLAYVGDQRQLMDLSVRMSATSIVATLIAVSALWQHGAWLLLALVPYGVAYLSYRGAVVVAHEYGAAVAAMIDLDRFALYDALRLPRPSNTTVERRMNAKLMKLLTHKDPGMVLHYAHPDAPASADGQPAAP